MHHQITPGAVVQTADQIELRVRALEGNVAELEAFDGSFVGFRHVSSLTVCLPPAAKTAPAQSLAAAAGTGQGAGTWFLNAATQARRGPYVGRGAQTRVRKLRFASRLTQVEAASRAHVSLRTFQRADAGDVVPMHVLRSIERALGAAW